MEPTHDALIQQFLQGSSVEAVRDAKEQLLSLGEEAATAIVSALKHLTLAPGSPPANTNHAIRLAELLVALESPQGLVSLLRLHELLGVSWPQGGELVAALLEAMKKRASAADIATLLQVLEHARSERAGPIVAQAIVELAEQQPLVALRPGLALLKPGLSTPLEYFTLHWRLRVALNKEALPIPATTPVADADLPIPAEERDLP